MKRLGLVFLAGVLLVSAVVLADTFGVLAQFNAGIFVGPKSVYSSTHKVTRILNAAYTIDFATQTATCGDSAGQTLTGVRTGDVCVVSPPAASTANTMFNCRVSATNTVIVRFCPTGAGAVDPASGSYNVTVISNQ